MKHTAKKMGQFQALITNKSQRRPEWSLNGRNPRVAKKIPNPEKVSKCSQRAKAVVREIAASNPNSLEGIRESRTFDYSCRGTIKSLFHGDPQICLGAGQRTEVRALSEWGDQAENFEFIAPMAMKVGGGNLNDMRGGFQHLEPAEARRYLVLEFPCFSIEEQAAILCFLNLKMPLSLIVHAEETSLQGWFYVYGRDAADVATFMDQVISLGANPTAWDPFQPVKLPGGIADDGFVQTVEFLNPGCGGLYQ